MIELDGGSEDDEDRTETTHDAGGALHGPQSSASFDCMSSVDGASSYTAPRDIPFSQRVPFHPVPKPQSRPQRRIASPDLGDCPTDPEAQAEWYKNMFKRVYEQCFGIHKDVELFHKQLIPDAFVVPPLPSAAGFESWLNTVTPSYTQHRKVSILLEIGKLKLNVIPISTNSKAQMITKRSISNSLQPSKVF